MMLPTTVRRVITAAPQSPLLSSFVPTATATRAPAALAFSCNPRAQQRRRYSSSKPSSPNDSPNGVSDGQATAASRITKGRRKAKETSNAQQQQEEQKLAQQQTQRLPSVPTTNHISESAVASSAFFSLHRPMSVYHSFPRVVTHDAFAQIFAPQPKHQYADVTSTLSQTIDQLEQPMQSMSLSASSDGETMADANGKQMQRIDLKHADGTETSVYVQLDTMSDQFIPFRPPPAPVAMSDAQTKTGAQQAVTEAPQHRIYKAMLTLEETVDEQGRAHVTAHSPQLIDENTVPRTYLERMALRQIRREQLGGRGRDMMAISVKRQRKLKMKKKKYKKLMKRTRNERRKLDRI
ncbi:hypothetical protein F4778DRAFT_96585 [Xylariomycetidae sp. FL2044]|nr:hypothetical protein F4778DRAFT_96585 [Xylariomycetidae sp. FL2044]